VVAGGMPDAVPHDVRGVCDQLADTKKDPLVTEKLEDLVAELRDADKQERTELLIEMAENLPPLPDRLAGHMDADHLVPECLTPVFLFAELDEEDRVVLYAHVPPESLTVRGFVALLVEGLTGLRFEEILQVPNDLVDRTGIPELVGPQRTVGLPRILRRLKAEVTRAAMARASAASPN
jgi:cysteine desulfuration protein SufE